MIGSLLRLLKRFAVLIPGIVIAYFSVHSIFPIIDKQVPWGLAIFFTYILAAYVLIPACIRVVRLVMPARHLPVYSVTPDGFASDPVNIGIIGSQQDLVKAMEAAGWFVADDHRLHNLFRAGMSILLNRPYPTAPMSNLYLLGRKQDIGFEIPIEGVRGHRHHVRFWATTHDSGAPLSAKTIHWQKRKLRHGSKGRDVLWLGAASRDVGFAVIRHNAQLTHMIHADTNAERKLIVDGLTRAGHITRTDSLRIGKPYRLVNRAWRGALHTDGNITICTLK